MSELCGCGCGQPPPVGKIYLRGHWSRTEAAKKMHRARRTIAPPNPGGLCQCGCGGVTSISKTPGSKSRPRVVGEHERYISGHGTKGKRGEQSPRWKGGRWKHKTGYIQVYTPQHPNATQDGYVAEHRLVIERVLGRYLTREEHVHHVNGVKDDNRAENLVVMSHSDHARLHPGPILTRYMRSAEGRETASRNGKKGAAIRWG